ncbi:uncharacterized protein METZ01_LOCUS236729, partial [marine metagenome]
MTLLHVVLFVLTASVRLQRPWWVPLAMAQ